MILTKYGSQAAIEGMKAGSFRITTLDVCRTTEAGGMMDDHEEGLGARSVTEDLHNVSFTDAASGNIFENVTSVGGGRSVTVFTDIDANIFCASIGEYNPKVHADIYYGSGDYRGNTDYTHAVMLDSQRIEAAFVRLGKCLFSTPFSIHKGEVSYSDDGREELVPAPGLGQLTDKRILARHKLKTVFTKPRRFSVEREYRFCALAGNHVHYRPHVVWTRDHSEDISKAFLAAVIDSPTGTLP